MKSSGWDSRIGDFVLIERGGDVIPKVVKVIESKRTGKEKKFPHADGLPVCGGLVSRPEGEAVSRCIAADCPAQLIGRLLHFASRRAMRIEGLGVALAEQLLEKKMVSDVADLYSLKLDDLASLERMAKKSASNVLAKSKRASLATFGTCLRPGNSSCRRTHRRNSGAALRFVGSSEAQRVSKSSTRFTRSA